MRRSTCLFSILLCAALTVMGSLSRADETPRIISIKPAVITRGDTITITGENLGKEGAKTTVKIDDRKVKFAEVEKGKMLTASVDTDPDTAAAVGGNGEYERAVTVAVGDDHSGTYAITQVTSWRVALKARVLVPLILYLVLVASIILGVKASVFKSKTGQPSLSKIQMGVWTFVFGLSYILLAAIHKEFLDITEGMFWLMGISSATAVGAKAIVLKNFDGLEKGHPSTLCKDWNKDRKPDAGYELSLHRCQLAIWTLIVLVIYVIMLIDTMRLPDIPEKLLVLMGISGGAYLGFNYPKMKKTESPKVSAPGAP